MRVTEPEAGAGSETVANLVEPVDNPMLFETIAARIEEWILSGQLEVGQRLPAEAELARQFGVSRPVLREALARLRDRGLVNTITGRGTYVQRPSAEHLAQTFLRHIRLEGTDGAAIENLYEARITLEAQCAQLAAIRATASDLAAIEAKLRDMERARGDTGRWTRADMAFHLAIAAASHNPFLLTLATPLSQAIERSISESHRSPDAERVALRAHHDICDAIVRRDAEAAADYMRQHLIQSQRYFSERLASPRSRLDGDDG